MQTVKITVSGDEPTKIILKRNTSENNDAKSRLVSYIEELIAAERAKGWKRR